MSARLVIFVLCLAAGGAAGWRLGLDHGALGALGGVAAAGILWLAVDLARAAAVLRWLRAGAAETPPRTRGVWGEVTDRVRRLMRARDKELAQAAQRLQDFLGAIQASPNGVVLLDAQGHIEWCNQTACGHFGFDAERDIQQLIGNLVRDPVFTAYWTAGDYTRDVVLTGPASTPTRPLRLAIQLHPYGEGRKLLLSRDITALDQADAMRRDFVANVSHEIRTPLTVLAGFVETLRTLSLDPQDQARYLELMAQQAQRMQSLVADLLTLSRLEGSPLPGIGEWTPAAALAGQCEHEARGLLAVLGKQIDLQLGPAPVVDVAGSTTELVSAMTNLVSNAVRYTPSGGRVVVEWTLPPSGRLRFSVRDTGPGIAPEHLPRLTERFYRVDRSRSRETGGTGLGLAIVKHVLQRHGAELRIDSTPGTGSTFSIELPASRVRPTLTPDGTSAPRARVSVAG